MMHRGTPMTLETPISLLTTIHHHSPSLTIIYHPFQWGFSLINQPFCGYPRGHGNTQKYRRSSQIKALPPIFLAKSSSAMALAVGPAWSSKKMQKINSEKRNKNKTNNMMIIVDFSIFLRSCSCILRL